MFSGRRPARPAGPARPPRAAAVPEEIERIDAAAASPSPPLAFGGRPRGPRRRYAEGSKSLEGSRSCHASVPDGHPRQEHGRGRALMRASGVAGEDIGKPIVAVANSFTEFVPAMCTCARSARWSPTPSRRRRDPAGVQHDRRGRRDRHGARRDALLAAEPELIADSVGYMVQAHCADALVCISNCDKITPGMLMAALRLNIPTVFVSGGPMEAGRPAGRGDRLRRAAQAGPDQSHDRLGRPERVRRGAGRDGRGRVPDLRLLLGNVHRELMNCLTEAMGWPCRATAPRWPRTPHGAAVRAGQRAGRRAGPALLRGRRRVRAAASIATRDAFENAMALDVAMGRSTNTILHLLAAAHEARVGFGLKEIDELSRRVPCLCKVAPSSERYHVEDVHRAGGIPAILGELDRAACEPRGAHGARLLARGVPRRLGPALAVSHRRGGRAVHAAPGGVRTIRPFSQEARSTSLDQDRPRAASGTLRTPTPGTAAWPCCTATWPPRARS